MKILGIVVLFLFSAVYIDGGVMIDVNHLAVPIESPTVSFGRLETPVLITSDMNWRGVVQPGRNVFRKGDTVSVIYSETTTDPSMFQNMKQAYSFDGGANWTEANIGHQNCMRTYPHQDQLFDVTNPNDPLGASPQIIWMERTNSGSDTLFFAQDEMVPFQLFTPYAVTTGLSTYFPCLCAWGSGESLFTTALDWDSKDIRGWSSENHGQNWTQVSFRPIGSDAGSVQSLIDNGDNGYGFAYYGVQHVANRPIYPMFKETTDFGQTWTTEQEFLNVAITDSLGAHDTLSLTWQGFSLTVDPVTNIPYIAAKLDPHKDPDYSYNYGEIWFTKPSGGTSGAYTFDADNPVPVFAGDTGVFEHLAGYSTISYYRSVSGLVLLVFFDALSQDSLSWQLYCASSTDEGNSWDVQQVTPNDTAMQNDMVDASYYVDDNGNVSVVYCNTITHGDTDHLNYFHLGVNVVTDLGLPAVAVEENPVNDVPSFYKVSTNMSSGNCGFSVGLPEGGMTSLKIYDASGRMVKDLVNRYLSAGNHYFDWNTSGTPSGNYIYRLASNGFITTGKVLITE